MKLPGGRLRALAARLCHPVTMQRVIDPLIADLQCEYADAIRRGRAWQAVRVRLAGYAAFWTALLLQIVVGRSWDAVDAAAVRRICRISIVATVAVTVLLALPPLMGVPASQREWFGGRFILYLIPQAVPLSLPVGLAVGILWGLRSRIVTPRVRRAILAGAVAASALSFVILAWVVPEANQSFRSLIARQVDGRLEPGPYELPPAELAKRIEGMDPFSPSTASWRFAYHGRYAISIAPVVLSLLALGIWAVARPRAIAIAWGAAGAVLYWAAFALMEVLVRAASTLRIAAPWLPDVVFTSAEALQPAVSLPPAAAWLPNAAFILLGALLFKLRPSATPDAPVPLA